MRQGITTKYHGPTNSSGSRIKAIARKAMPSIGAKAMALTVPYDYSGGTDEVHCRAAKALATKLGWSGLWVAGGKPDEDGNMYVCIPGAALEHAPLGKEGADWFYVSATSQDG